MMELPTIARIAGAVLALPALLCVFLPGVAREWIRRFPRNKPVAWILTAVDLVWSGFLLFDMPLGPVEQYKPLLYLLVPVTFILVIMLLDDLLAARALGGLFMLVPAPVLDAARWHPSQWRLILTVLVYFLAVVGMAMVLGPYRLRRYMGFWVSDDGHCRALGAVWLALGLLIAVLSFTAY